MPDKEQGDFGTRELPLELAFLAAEDISPELMEEAVGATHSAVWSLERLLSEGKIIEEAYYRALAIHLGCEYIAACRFFRRGKMATLWRVTA